MARRNASATATDEVEATENTTTEVVEEPTEAPVAESTVESTDALAEEEAPIDLTAFQESAREAVENADSSTGEPGTEAIASVNNAYRDLDGAKAKNAAKNWLDEQMKAAISGEGDFSNLDNTARIIRARSYVNIREALTAARSGGSTTSTPADPTEAFVNKVVAMRIALDLVVGSVPEGVSEDWMEKADTLGDSLAQQVSEYKAYQESDDEDAEAPEVNAVVRAAFKAAATRAGRASSPRAPFTGVRRDVKKHIAQVFDSLESGSYLSVAEIAKAASEEYGDDRPSAGAVSAALFPKGKEPFKGETFEAKAKTDDRPNGAVKL